MPNDFLTETHPIWTAHHAEWERRERLLRGGADVINAELVLFENETESGRSIAARRAQAVYPGFGDAFARTMVGHVLKDRPDEDGALVMGKMGKIKREEGAGFPSQAEQVYYNINGVGGDGQQLWQWVASLFQRAAATGIRWVFVEMPAKAAGTRRGELDGARPYAVEFSPRAVTNWKFDRGQLQWCVISVYQDTRRVEAGRMMGAANEQGYYLLVRKGATDLGDEYSRGGWWKFDKDRKELETGNWDRTNGEIPMAIAPWEWATEGVATDQPVPLARGGTFALDNLSVAHMNAVSAWRHNMWRSAGGPTFLLGVDSETWKIAVEQWNAGATLLGVPATKAGEGVAPTVAHSGAAAVSAESFKALLEHMTAEAERLMVQEATSTPDSSGRSKEAGFTESRAPRLTMLAENIESFLNTVLRFFEMRFGHASPGAYVTMPREFDLAPLEEDIRDFFDTFRLSELRSATLESEAMIQLAEKKGLVNDKNREAVRGELVESATAEQNEADQERQARRDLQDALRRGTAGAEG